jgi:hypothetical protein
MAARNNSKHGGGPPPTASSRESACAVLGIPVYATEGEGRKAYRTLVGLLRAHVALDPRG